MNRFLIILLCSFYTCTTAAINLEIRDRGGGSNASLKFFSLGQIKKENSFNLEVASTYHVGNNCAVQANPIFANNLKFTVSKEDLVIGLNLSNGFENWRTKFPGEVEKLILAYYDNNSYILFLNGAYVLKVLDRSINKCMGNDSKFRSDVSALLPFIYDNFLEAANVTRDGYSGAFSILHSKQLWMAALPASWPDPPIRYDWNGIHYILFTGTGCQHWVFNQSDAITAYI